ncbi:hypothetical protein BX616_003239 [Lobosporangium transversale]|uniref:F-box domain-containing protein n=1 Tax=Lobosporangium transversale TaxID=64571 RepID=A0A1Y2GZJ3_9FUNG|nr:hypothetical protein BCR41DRAFT_367313 [Lobosporangium transversale]KAF9918989.1 hypothetical protein BX616_003239 [Lobosporangium transversale]ORZ27727.1 hypothetical protein BCR41DRAFT_367313 [Lobosporangium transversale]|eukprot:XP_021885430.1 hypothetical protein BCR41DRAFT_367313 [Lobosporangium transversale]
MQATSANATTTTAVPTNQWSEIRTLIHQALDLRSMINCSQVSKSWSAEFTPRIWNTINLSSQPRFSELPSNIIAKNGQHIRIVRTVRKKSEFELFRDPSIQNIEQIRVRPKPSCRQQTFQLIRRNSRTLLKLDIRMGKSIISHPDFALEDAFVSPDLDFMPRLTELRIQNLTMTRKALSTLLSRCPNLTYIDILSCAIHGDGRSPGELYQHKGVIYLHASYHRVFNPDPDSPSDSDTAVVPLLAHFPKLEYWNVWAHNIQLKDSGVESIETAIKKYSPGVKKLTAYRATGSIVHDLLAKAFKNIESICFNYENLSTSGILGFLLHSSTLRTLRAIDPNFRDWSYDADRVIPVPDPLPNAWMIHMIFSRCAFLTSVDLPEHELDMDIIDIFPWACKDLARLRIRIKGLDTKELIMAMIRKWSRGVYIRRRQRWMGEQGQTASKYEGKAIKTPDSLAAILEEVARALMTDRSDGKDEIDDMISNDFNSIVPLEIEGEPANPVVDRVAAHLLKFEKLSEVWLGYKVWRL